MVLTQIHFAVSTPKATGRDCSPIALQEKAMEGKGYTATTGVFDQGLMPDLGLSNRGSVKANPSRSAAAAAASLLLPAAVGHTVA